MSMGNHNAAEQDTVKAQAAQKLMDELDKGRKSGETEGWLSLGDIHNAMAERAAIDATISEAEAEYQCDGQLCDAKESLTSLREKHFE